MLPPMEEVFSSGIGRVELAGGSRRGLDFAKQDSRTDRCPALSYFELA